MAQEQTAVQTAQPHAVNSLRTMLEKAQPRLAEVAPKHLKVERLIRLLLAAASRNPKILQCSQESVLQFAMKCSETGLEPIGAGGAWPIPYENRKNKTTELTFIADYRGLLNAARWSECIKWARAEVVKENDLFSYSLGLRPDLTHEPARTDRGELIAAYCVYTLMDGEKEFVVMHKDEIEAIRNVSPAWRAFVQFKKEGPWNTHPAEMWKKTVVRRAMKPFAGNAPAIDAALEYDAERADGVEMRPNVPLPKATEEGNGAAGQIEGEAADTETICQIEECIAALDLKASETKKRIKAVGAESLAAITQEQADALLAKLQEEASVSA